ncbi:MAG: OadG family protein [Saccharofermentanales bacterium]
MPLLFLQSWTKEFGTLSEKTFLGSTMALVGISIVFIMLVVIVFSIFLMSSVINKRKKKLISTELLTGDAGIIDETIAATDHDDNELIAVITAAIAMISSSEEGNGAPYPGFKVRSIKRTRFYNIESDL